MRKGQEEKVDLTGLAHLFLAAVATSIDACAVGVSLAMSDVPSGDMWVLTAAVGLTTMAAASASTGEGNGEDMMKSMQMMNNFMPLISVWFCFTLPVGVGIYWVMSAVVRTVQQLVINKYLEKMDIDEEIKKNIEKYNRKREKDGLPPQKLNDVARSSTKTVEVKNTKKREITSEERQKQIKDSTEYYKKGEAKPGSLAAKARMVEQYNEKTKKK